jgi:transposase-like protein
MVDHLRYGGLTDAAEHLDQPASEILTFTGFPKAHRRQIWSNDSQARLNKEIRSGTSACGCIDFQCQRRFRHLPGMSFQIDVAA